jgi:hypothetical protein
MRPEFKSSPAATYAAAAGGRENNTQVSARLWRFAVNILLPKRLFLVQLVKATSFGAVFEFRHGNNISTAKVIPSILYLFLKI